MINDDSSPSLLQVQNQKKIKSPNDSQRSHVDTHYMQKISRSETQRCPEHLKKSNAKFKIQK